MMPEDIYGPTAVGDLFNPGPQSLTGTFDPVFVAREASYGGWNVTPQPSAGIAWTPRSDGIFIERMLGGDKSVLRGSYSFRRFTMPQQFMWDYGSSFGRAFYQEFMQVPVSPPHPGGSCRAASRSARPAGCRNHAPPHPLRRVSSTARRSTTESST